MFFTPYNVPANKKIFLFPEITSNITSGTPHFFRQYTVIFKEFYCRTVFFVKTFDNVIFTKFTATANFKGLHDEGWVVVKRL